MNDQEARAVVAQVVTEGLAARFPEAQVSVLHKSSVDLVNAVITEYLKCRLLGNEMSKGKAS